MKIASQNGAILKNFNQEAQHSSRQISWQLSGKVTIYRYGSGLIKIWVTKNLLRSNVKNVIFEALTEEYGIGITQSENRLATSLTVRGSNPVGGEIFHTHPDRP
jgi:hypothetical protein